MSEVHHAYLIITMDGDEEAATSAGIYSEYPIATIGARNLHQFLIARSSGSTYAQARDRLREFLAMRNVPRDAGSRPARPLLWEIGT